MREDNFEEDNFEEEFGEEFGEELYREYLYFEYKDEYDLLKKEVARKNYIINKLITNIEDTKERTNYYADECNIDCSILAFWIDLLKDALKNKGDD